MLHYYFGAGKHKKGKRFPNRKGGPPPKRSLSPMQMDDDNDDDDDDDNNGLEVNVPMRVPESFTPKERRDLLEESSNIVKRMFSIPNDDDKTIIGDNKLSFATTTPQDVQYIIKYTRLTTPEEEMEKKFDEMLRQCRSLRDARDVYDSLNFTNKILGGIYQGILNRFHADVLNDRIIKQMKELNDLIREYYFIEH